MKAIGLVLVTVVVVLGIMVASRPAYRRALVTRFMPNSNVSNPSMTPGLKPSDPLRTPSSTNPFGVMLGSNKPITAASALGARYYRPISVFTDTWNGICEECQRAKDEGFTLVLTVRTNGGNGKPSTPPTDIAAYKKKLGEIIDTYKPAVLVVENEENSAALFYTGTPEDYFRELTAACEVAHTKGITCANGGLVSSLVVVLTANSYKEAGDIGKATAYIERTIGSKLEDQFAGMSPSKIFDNPKAKSQIERGKALLAGYKKSGADYVNFHWYVADTDALSEAVTYLEKASGLTAMTNELGQQKNESPEQVTSVMEKVVDLGIPYVVWFSIDVAGYGEAKGLVNQDGSLRPNGQAFADFIQETF